jgi:tetratricopeptide (TPR) repeat protein
MTVQNIVILIVLAAGGYYAYTKFGGQEKVNQAIDSAKVDHWQKAEGAFTGGLWQDVITHYEAALKEKPDDPRAAEAEFRIARAHDRLKHDSEAMKLYQAFLAKHPNYNPEDRKIIQARIETYKGLGVK